MLLMACLKESRGLYNAMLERTKAQYTETGKFLFKYDLCTAFKGQAPEHVPATTVQCLAERLDKALRAYLFRTEREGKAGFPRFKSANQWHSIRLRQHPGDFSLDGRYLKLPAKLGKRLKIKLHRSLEGDPKTCHLVLRADGHWYALIACEIPTPKALATDERPAIGIDVGLKVFLADSNGEFVENPRYYRASQAALRRKQRILSRRKKGSHRRRKAARSVAKTHLKVERQRRDFHFKAAKQYADNHSLIAVEHLQVANLAHNNHLSKSIYDASWDAFLSILADKAERAGGRVVQVPARFTTQQCSNCRELVPKSLSVRTHICPHCGYVADRDTNAARNILQAALTETGGGTAVGES